MKQLFTLILPVSIALAASFPLLRAAEVPAVMLKQIDQLKTDAEAQKDMPKELAGVNQVTTDDAIKMWKAKSAIFLDNRPKTQFDTERIEGAQWFPIDELLKNPGMAAKLDKTKKYIAYCNGAHCWRSPAVVMILNTQGYDNVLWYRDGVPGWKKMSLPTE